MNIARPILAPHARYRWDEQRRQHQLIFPEGLLVLTDSAAAIIRLCDGRSTRELIAALEAQLPGNSLAEDVTEFLARLARKGVIRDGVGERLAVSLPETKPRAERADYSRPFALVAELTYRCPLKCPYCSNPLEPRRYQDELDTDTWKRVLAEAAALGIVQVHFSGGEPLVRRDLPDIVAAAKTLDLYTNLSTGGTLADQPYLQRLRDAGLDSIQISLLDARPSENDWLAGATSFDKKRHAVEVARALGFPVTLNVVLHRHNLDHLEKIVALAEAWQVNKLELAHAQYVGWAFRNRAALHPTREQFERAETVVAEARQRLGATMEILHVLPDYFQRFPKACLHGWGRVFLTVAPDGAVLPCQTAREIPGLDFPNVRNARLEEIWLHAPVFQRFRGTEWMPEPCRSCDRREIDFGGCRCQAFLLTGDPAATDPVCSLSPLHHVVTNAVREIPPAPAQLQFRLY